METSTASACAMAAKCAVRITYYEKERKKLRASYFGVWGITGYGFTQRYALGGLNLIEDYLGSHSTSQVLYIAYHYENMSCIPCSREVIWLSYHGVQRFLIISWQWTAYMPTTGDQMTSGPSISKAYLLTRGFVPLALALASSSFSRSSKSSAVR